jgi:hypothetical protein
MKANHSETMGGIDVSAGLNTKFAGLFRFSGVFGISVPDNRRELYVFLT